MTRYIKAKGVSLRKVTDSYFLLNPRKGKIHELNETALFVWNHVINGDTIDEILEKLILEYKVNKEKAKKDLVEIIEKFLKEGLLDVPDSL